MGNGVGYELKQVGANGYHEGIFPPGYMRTNKILTSSGGGHSDLDCRIVSKNDFPTSSKWQEHLIARHLYLLMDVFWIIKSSFSLFGTKLARNQQRIDQYF